MIEKAIIFLKKHGIESFEQAGGILVIPATSTDDMLEKVPVIKSLLKECGFNKSWLIDPYYYERHSKIENEMYGGNE